MAATDAQRAIDAVWRIESAKVVASVARLVRDVGLAEELAQDALVSALEHWPESGVPDNPGAWLMTTAKHRALDWLRQAALHARKQDELGRDADARGDHMVPDIAEAIADAEGDVIGDDLLRLIFTACHPVLSADARIALTLKLLGGLSTEEIARAFLVPEPTIAQRIVRAKRTLGEAKVPFEVPAADALRERLASVLEVVYAIFNEGYTGTRGDDWMRPALMQDALRLGRMLAELAREDSEVHGLVALMELHASRAAARVDAQGRPVLLSDQDRSRWDRLLIRRGLAALDRARALAVAASNRSGPMRCRPPSAPATPAQPGPTTPTGRASWRCTTRWCRPSPSPVVQLNRAVAVGMAFGPESALEIVDALQADGALRDYQWLPSVRADLLAKLGRHAEARAELMRAATLARNARERELLLERAHAAAPAPPAGGAKAPGPGRR